ncbi:MAG: ABC transporter permease [Kurthia gibsonii]|uniref:ABC transporter permease n=1 Tax=Kurthia gibsonii TaxID=33946 RepID=A0ABU9LJC4_9BACL|nr:MULTISPECIES: ABC transporter permease [Kurthia]MCA9724853.1 ABC transporter permease [Kurthia sp.]AMA62473.1 branched-chain amino acid transport system / permease component family protein [Kurthia sp. 11kri321]MEB6111671.1 ABC transporter permease [Kurthia gibsonii]MEB7771823.1 ABC transporter permease [Kurthia gibsonii]RXH52985.1 ABC transporter permease [Kurthia gibsonii]
MSFLDVLEFIIPSAILYASPLIITAIGGVFTERSGVVNIGLEGIMVIGAFISIVFNLSFADQLGTWTPWVGLLVAMVVGLLFSLILAVAAVSLRADQTVSGVALNMLALAVAVFSTKLIYEKGQTDSISQRFSRFDIPVLSDIPVLGKMFFTDVYGTSILAIVVAILAWFVLFKTPFGLRIRSVGEHPMAADTMGVKVTRIRYYAVMISGALGGIGGAIYAQAITGNFAANTISGQGFIAIAAMIFGKWHPLGALGAALFFGLAQSLSIVGTSIPYVRDVPEVVLFILPYVLTILALAGFVGKATAPKASGKPYIKGKR